MKNKPTPKLKPVKIKDISVHQIAITYSGKKPDLTGDVRYFDGSKIQLHGRSTKEISKDAREILKQRLTNTKTEV